MQNVGQTVISQYANSPTINALIASWNAALDPSALVSEFITNELDLDTAVGYGLDVLGRIVGVVRVLQIASSEYFGFSGPDGGSGDSYDTAPFFSGGGLTSNYTLTDDAFRQLIQAKALANICDGSVPGINNILMLLFGASGSCYVETSGHMALTYVFNFTPTPVQLSIIQTSGVLPSTAGRSVTVVHQ